MAAYYIWDPHVVTGEPETLEFILTRGDADTVAQGTKEFMRALLHDIGVEVDVARWSVDPCRTEYFSEYLGEEDWRDNWQLVWRVRVITTRRIGELPSRRSLWIGTNASDESWSLEDRLSDDAVVGCLVIGDFRKQADLEKAESGTLSDNRLARMRARYAAGVPIFESYDVLGNYKQLQVTLGRFPGEFFANGADYAMRVMELFKKAKGTVHFESRKI